MPRSSLSSSGARRPGTQLIFGRDGLRYASKALFAGGVVRAFLPGHAALAATFGKVVSIGGHASDVALDEPRGVLYIANFTANRIEVMSLATKTLLTEINVMPQPYSISVSPDGHWLLLAHYGNVADPGIARQRSYADRSDQPLCGPDVHACRIRRLGLAFGVDNRALVVTTKNFLIFDPTTGTSQVMISIPDQAAKTHTAAGAEFSAQHRSGVGGRFRRWELDLRIRRYPDLPLPCPVRELSISTFYGSPASARAAGSQRGPGRILRRHGLDHDRPVRPQLRGVPESPGTLNVGGHAIDSVRGLVFSEVQQNLTDPPVLTVRDADNLTLRDRLQLPEHLAGRAVLSSDRTTMYASSDSGVLVLPVGNLNLSPRLTASVEDLVFRGNFCDRSVATQTFVLSEAGGRLSPVQHHFFQSWCFRFTEVGYDPRDHHGASRPPGVCRPKRYGGNSAELQLDGGGEPGE